MKASTNTPLRTYRQALVCLAMRAVSQSAVIVYCCLFLSGCSFAGKGISKALHVVNPFANDSSLDEEEAARYAHPPVPVEMLPEPSLPETQEVREEIRFFQEKNPRGLRQAIERKNQFYPLVSKIFRDEGVPEVLLNLAIIESGFNPAARSPVGAMGIWQLMKSTAKIYGVHALKKGDDERQDPILSSLAAARHLKDLYRRYQDWHLALAAYNAGIGAINRAMVRSGSNDYWEIIRKRKLCAQTRRYVPKFIAVSLIAQEPQKYGFSFLPKPEDSSSLALNRGR